MWHLSLRSSIRLHDSRLQQAERTATCFGDATAVEASRFPKGPIMQE